MQTIFSIMNSLYVKKKKTMQFFKAGQKIKEGLHKREYSNCW